MVKLILFILLANGHMTTGYEQVWECNNKARWAHEIKTCEQTMNDCAYYGKKHFMSFTDSGGMVVGFSCQFFIPQGEG